MRRMTLNGLVTLSLIASPAIAEPTRVPRWLMAEPMSVFDWGIYKTEKRLEDLKVADGLFNIRYVTGSVEYEWAVDRIKINVVFQGAGTDVECTENLKKAKGAFLNFTWNEADYPRLGAQVLAGLFSHEGGYKSGSQPKDVGDQLVNITVLEATVLAQGPNGEFSSRVRCQTTFKSKEMSVVRGG